MRSTSVSAALLGALLLVTGGDINAQVPTAGLIAHWAFDEGSGTMAGDSSGGGHNGTLVNGPIWTSGIAGGALSFDGIDDYVAIPDSVDFDFGYANFTICAWFRTTVGLSEQYIIDFFRDGNFPHIEIYTGLPLHGLGSHLCGVGDVCTRLSDGAVDNGGWHHVVITLSNSVASGYQLWVDGIKTTWGTFSQSLDDWDTISIASRVFVDGTANEPWSGEIDEVLIYDRVLSDTEIVGLYAFYPVDLQRFTID
jgi:hypothetical protein